MRGKVFCIMSVVPQNGAKYVATNLGYFIKKTRKNKSKKVLLIDFDFKNPTLCYHYINESIYNIDKLSLIEKDLDNEVFERTVSKTKLGFDVLKGTEVCNSELISKELIANILNISKEMYDYIFVVINSNINNPATVISLLNATKVILVTKNDYTNNLKIEGALSTVKKFMKDKSNINILYNYSNYLHKIKVSKKIKDDTVDYLSILDYAPKSIDNINLGKKLFTSKKTINDNKFKKICKIILSD